MRFLTFVLMIFMVLPAWAEDTAFDRVMKTGVLRCGYYVFPPITYRDQKTDELSGFAVDMMNAIGKRGNLKIEWSEEVTFGNWVEALQSNRFDAVCTPMWPEIAQARVAAFSAPIVYAALSPLVRADDERFKDVELSRFNQKDVTFLAQDGSNLGALTREVFPNATIKDMPAALDGPTLLQEIVTGKADAIILDRNAEIEYNRNNPVKLKLVNVDNPVKVQSFTLVVGRKEMILKDFLDNALNELHNDGSIDRMMTKWETEPGLFLRVAQPYKAAE